MEPPYTVHKIGPGRYYATFRNAERREELIDDTGASSTWWIAVGADRVGPRASVRRWITAHRNRAS